jgi:CBS domain containing-hemolysin-like protein
MYSVHVLLHISVLLFFCGVSDYLFDLHPTVGLVSWSCVAISTAAYVVLSILPLIFGNCPYQTALTIPLRFFFFFEPILFWNTSPRLSPVVTTSRYIYETDRQKVAPT